MSTDMAGELDLPGLGLRWGGALAAVLGLHALAVMLLMHRAVVPFAMPPAPEAVMLDLAPDLPPAQEAAVAPPTPALLQPPPPIAPMLEPPPPEIPTPETLAPEIPPVELPPTPPVPAEAVLPEPPRAQPRPKPRPIERSVERRPERRPERQLERRVERPAPVTRDEAPPLAQAPAPTGPAPQAARPAAPPSNALPTWRSELLARLQRAKRYPELARSRGAQGVATVSFTLDRGGRVLNVGLVRSAGSPLLDDEAVALVHRAEPLPRLPDEMPGATVTLSVPISFALR